MRTLPVRGVDPDMDHKIQPINDAQARGIVAVLNKDLQENPKAWEASTGTCQRELMLRLAATLCCVEDAVGCRYLKAVWRGGQIRRFDLHCIVAVACG